MAQIEFFRNLQSRALSKMGLIGGSIDMRSAD
jgi:hypothetical protein